MRKTNMTFLISIFLLRQALLSTLQISAVDSVASLSECGSLLSPINPYVTSSPGVTTPGGKNGPKITTPFLLMRFKS